MSKVVEHFEDGSFSVVEDSCPVYCKTTTVKFGPLSTTLGDLYSSGFRLECHGKKARSLSRGKIYLVRKVTSERYIVAKVRLSDVLGEEYSLADFILDGAQLIQRGAGRVNTIYLKPNPWDELLSKYTTSKREVMIGNKTLKEAVQQALVSKRG